MIQTYIQKMSSTLCRKTVTNVMSLGVDDYIISYCILGGFKPHSY